MGFKWKNKTKPQEKNPNETEIIYLKKRVQSNSNKNDYWTWRRIEEHNENFKKKLENVKKNQ